MDMDIVGNLFNTSNNITNNTSSSRFESSVSSDDITSLLMRSFNEAEDNDDSSEDEIDWGTSSEEENNQDNEQTDVDNQDDQEEQDEQSEDDEEYSSEDELSDSDESTTEDDSSEGGEILGAYEAIKDELDSERETLSEIYERFFKEIVDPLFRKLEDSNINVAFDTTKLKTEGLIRIELSHRNSSASAEMEINVFANNVNGEFLGMENSDGEAVSTSLDDVSLDDLLTILIKVLAS